MKYTYSITEDTLNQHVNTNKLQFELDEAQIDASISITDDELNILTSKELSSSDLMLLKNVINQHDGQELDIEIVKGKYEKYRNDGVEYVDKWRASLVLDYYDKKYTKDEIFEIEESLHFVSCRIRTGDWMSALNKLNQVVVNELVTQEMIDGISNDIIEYIQKNY